MKNHPIHGNPDTSFVNLSALLRYLRRRRFVGKVRVELSGYEADVILTAENQLKALEHDRIAGCIAEGKETLQRLPHSRPRAERNYLRLSNNRRRSAVA